MRAYFSLGCLGLGCAVIVGACGGGNGGTTGFPADAGGDRASSSSSSGGGSGSGSSSGSLLGDGSGGEAGPAGDPTTCSEAESSHSYIGCDYWPTVTANGVWSVFDFAAVVANAGATMATVTVTGPGNPPVNQTVTVAPGGLTKIYLPWVKPLKGGDMDACGAPPPLPGSVLARSAAYHLVASVPVTVYQFSALEYAGSGGPSGKDWSSCPGTSQICAQTGGPITCFSFTNDASLLLPSTAMTGNYRVTGHGGWGVANMGAFMAITATQANTTVNVKVSGTGSILAGGGISTTAAGGMLTLTMNAGDVAELVGGTADTSDLSGSVVQAVDSSGKTAPVQVITGLPCLDVPDTAAACDHVEESNFPAETLGEDYVVSRPTGPLGNAVGQIVRIYGNVDGTTLTYAPSTPAGCPATINAGQVVDCGVVNEDFEVKSSAGHSFAVGIFTQGASVVDPATQPPNQQGDPDQSLTAAVKQYRTKYVFLAPTDYLNNFAVVVAPTGTTVSIDGANATATATPVGTTGYGVLRIKLDPGNAGAHVLTASNPVGLQVMGYGSYTSYMYPGGLDLAFIAPPPAL